MDGAFFVGWGTVALTAGANGDGRFNTVGGVVKHVFPAEQREE